MAVAASIASYKEILLFLGTAGVVIPLFQRLRVSPILGFLAVGALLGPHALGRLVDAQPLLGWMTISESRQFEHLAEFGVVFLLFMIGLELSLERLWTLRRLLFGLGSLQVILCTIAIAAAGYGLGLGRAEALLCGAAMALSSTAIVAQVLADEHRLAGTTGRASFSVLIFQDLAVAPLLFMVTVLGARRAGGLDTLGWEFASLALQAIASLAVIVLSGRYLLRPLLRHVAEYGSREFFMAACLLVVIGAGVVASAGGQSMALGAFVAGLLLAETEYRREIEVTIEPFKGLLLGVFFFSVGMSVDWSRVAAQPLLIVLLLVALLAVKGAVIFALARFFRLSRLCAFETAALLATAGEFAFVLIGAGQAKGLVTTAVASTAIAVCTISMALVPLIGKTVFQILPRLRPPRAVDPVLSEMPPDTAVPSVVIGGYGRVGELIASILDEHGVAYIAVDSVPNVVSLGRRRQRALFYGDLSNPEFLKAAHIESARALVLTMDSPSKVEAVVRAVRRLRPDLPIIARARDGSHAHSLYELGVTEAVPETVEASLQLGEATLVSLGKPMGLVLASIHERRDAFKQEFQRVAADQRSGLARRVRAAEAEQGKHTTSRGSA